MHMVGCLTSLGSKKPHETHWLLGRFPAPQALGGSRRDYLGQSYVPIPWQSETPRPERVAALARLEKEKPDVYKRYVASVREAIEFAKDNYPENHQSLVQYARVYLGHHDVQ